MRRQLTAGLAALAVVFGLCLISTGTAYAQGTSGPCSPSSVTPTAPPGHCHGDRGGRGGPWRGPRIDNHLLYLDLNTTVAAAGNNPPEDPAAAQAYVIAEYEANGHFAAGVDAVKLDSACSANHSIPGGL